MKNTNLSFIQMIAAPTSLFDGLVQERYNSSALEMELHLSCTNASIWWCSALSAFVLHLNHLIVSDYTWLPRVQDARCLLWLSY